MIATNLIATLLMALGVATGNVSSNTCKGGNAFNNEIKTKPIQKANTPINQTYTFTAAQYWQDTNARNRNDAKYYLGDNVNVASAYYNIYSTTYMFTRDVASDNADYKLITIMKITSYFNAQGITNSLYQNLTMSVPSGHTYSILANTIDYETTQNLDQYIDMNLNANTKQEVIIATLVTYKPQDAQINSYNFGNQSNWSRDITNTYSPNLMLANETRWVVMITEVSQIGSPQNDNSGYISPSSMTITGTAVTPDVNYEVVDIPNVMFTILTLPFSWYSTAFNLTIFPGTPYALNFGNLVLTIVAAMILLYLIRKIIK